MLFLAWPIITLLLLFFVAVVCIAAWLFIPFGVPTMENNSWTLKFPWSKP